jgi:hypothetical protein
MVANTGSSCSACTGDTTANKARLQPALCPASFVIKSWHVSALCQAVLLHRLLCVLLPSLRC